MRLNSKQLRNLDENQAEEIKKGVKRMPLIFILDTIYDTYNTGSFFRLADALAVQKMYLTGDMETPPNIKIKRAAVGTDKIIDWEYKKDIQQAIKEAREKYKAQIIAVEQTDKSIDYRQIEYRLPVALILGNETQGVSKQALELADFHAEIPMYGVNKSLNVLVSASVISYWILRDQPSRLLFSKNQNQSIPSGSGK